MVWQKWQRELLLAKIAKIVDSSLLIFVDCGISSGMDAFKFIGYLQEIVVL